MNILFGITGGIAAYKMCNVISYFRKEGNNVKVAMTKNATHFITPLTMQTLSGNKVVIDMFDSSGEMYHISLAKWCDGFIIAPATANIIGKLANGIADDIITTTALATDSPIGIVPAMNTTMYNNSILQANIKKLVDNGYKLLAPDSGYLACGDNGKGRFPDIDRVVDFVKCILYKDKSLDGKRVVITSGGTREYIDKVRVITNLSSGKMGMELARASKILGAEVVYIYTDGSAMPPIADKYIKVVSAMDMYEAVKQEFEGSDILIMAAAVSDYKVERPYEGKIKKTQRLTLNLVKNIDIISEMAKIKKSGQYIVGFAAESRDLIENARKKLKDKGIDMIIANDISRSDIGFSSDYNEVSVISSDIIHIAKSPKSEIALNIVKIIADKIR